MTGCCFASTRLASTPTAQDPRLGAPVLLQHRFGRRHPNYLPSSLPRCAVCEVWAQARRQKEVERLSHPFALLTGHVHPQTSNGLKGLLSVTRLRVCAANAPVAVPAQPLFINKFVIHSAFAACLTTHRFSETYIPTHGTILPAHFSLLPVMQKFQRFESEIPISIGLWPAGFLFVRPNPMFAWILKMNLALVGTRPPRLCGVWADPAAFMLTSPS